MDTPRHLPQPQETRKRCENGIDTGHLTPDQDPISVVPTTQLVSPHPSERILPRSSPRSNPNPRHRQEPRHTTPIPTHAPSEEIAALDEYRSTIEYYLLRLKSPMAMGNHRPSHLHHIAGYLRWLNSDKVVGPDGNEPPRKTFVQEMFRDRPVHKWSLEEVERTLGSGEVNKEVSIHFTSRSTALSDKYAELEVLAFFCANGYSVEFPDSGGSGKRPEFYLTAGPHTIGVEVKNLDSNTALDHIFGSPDHYAVPPLPDGDQEIPNDIAAVVGTIKTQYKKACEKFTGVPILIVIYVPWPPSLLQPDFDEWRKDLTENWRNGCDEGVVGVVLAGHDEMVNPARQEVVDAFQFDSIPLKELRNVYVRCSQSSLWPG